MSKQFRCITYVVPGPPGVHRCRSFYDLLCTLPYQVLLSPCLSSGTEQVGKNLFYDQSSWVYSPSFLRRKMSKVGERERARKEMNAGQRESDFESAARRENDCEAGELKQFTFQQKTKH